MPPLQLDAVYGVDVDEVNVLQDWQLLEEQAVAPRVQHGILQSKTSEALQLQGSCSGREEVRRHARKPLDLQLGNLVTARSVEHRRQHRDHAIFLYPHRYSPSWALQQLAQLSA